MTYEEMLKETVENIRREPYNDLVEFLGTKEADLGKFHFSVGMNIRNHFKMWENTWEPKIVDGIDISPEHPDNISMKLIIDTWRTLNDEQLSCA